MHSECTAGRAIAAALDEIAAALDLIEVATLALETEPRLEFYGSDWALLRPAPAEEADEPRYALTDLGRRVVAQERCFGPWPTVAQVLHGEQP